MYFRVLVVVLCNVVTDCQEGDILGQLAWIIPVSIIGGIVLLGILILVIAKCILLAIVRSLHCLYSM